MTLQLPYGETITAEYQTVEVKKFLGSDVVVIGNLFYFNHNDYAYKQYCKDAGYMDYYECENEYKETPIMNNESLLSFAHYNKGMWQNIDKLIEYNYTAISQLNQLKGEL